MTRRNVVAGDHLRIAHARTDHRIDTGFRIDDDLKKRRAVELNEILHDSVDIRGLVQAFRPGKSVGLGGLERGDARGQPLQSAESQP